MWRYARIPKEIEEEPSFMRPINMISKIEKDNKMKNLLKSVRTKFASGNRCNRKQYPISEYLENVFKVSKSLLAYSSILTSFCRPETSQQTSLQSLDHMLALLVIIRKLVSLENNPPLNEVVNCDLVPFLFKVLHCGIIREYKREYEISTSSSPATGTIWRKLVFEASWILTNIASGAPAHTTIVVSNLNEDITKLTAIETLLLLLHIDSTEIRQQTLWSIANITGDNAQYRHDIIYAKIPTSLRGAKYFYKALSPEGVELNKSEMDTISTIDLIYNIYNESKTSIYMTRIISWALSNCFRGKPIDIDVQTAATAAKILAEMVLTCADNDILADALWGIAYGKFFKYILDISRLKELIPLT